MRFFRNSDDKSLGFLGYFGQQFLHAFSTIILIILGIWSRVREIRHSAE